MSLRYLVVCALVCTTAFGCTPRKTVAEARLDKETTATECVESKSTTLNLYYQAPDYTVAHAMIACGPRASDVASTYPQNSYEQMQSDIRNFLRLHTSLFLMESQEMQATHLRNLPAYETCLRASIPTFTFKAQATETLIQSVFSTCRPLMGAYTDSGIPLLYAAERETILYNYSALIIKEELARLSPAKRATYSLGNKWNKL